jgi:energy-converting hydrogenase Eha subunit C
MFLTAASEYDQVITIILIMGAGENDQAISVMILIAASGCDQVITIILLMATGENDQVINYHFVPKAASEYDHEQLLSCSSWPPAGTTR